MEFQDFVIDSLDLPIVIYSSEKFQKMKGESKSGIEIKYDRNFRETGNLYIETAEKSKAENKEYIASGIYRNDNTWLWVIGDYNTLYFLSKLQLQALEKQYNGTKEMFKHVMTETSEGFLLPIQYARRKNYFIRIVEFPY